MSCCMFEYEVSKQEAEVRQQQLSNVEHDRVSLSTNVPVAVENSEVSNEKAEVPLEENTEAASQTEETQSEEKEAATADAVEQKPEDNHGVVEKNAEEEENGKWDRSNWNLDRNWKCIKK